MIIQLPRGSLGGRVMTVNVDFGWLLIGVVIGHWVL